MFELGRVDDDDGQPEQDHVAADLGRRLRQPEAQERAGSGRPRGRSRSSGALAGRGVAVAVTRPVRRRACRRRTAAVIAGSPRSTNPARRRSSDAALEQDVAAAALAAQADVGAEPVDQPGVAAARVGAPEPDDVAEEQREDGSVRHRRVRVSEPRLAVRRDEVAIGRRQRPAGRPG